MQEPYLSRADGFIYCFDEEVALCKQIEAKSGRLVQVSYKPEVLREGDPTSIVYARFPDGTQHTVSGLTAESWGRIERDKSNTRSGEGVLWEATHKETNHRVYIKQRVDRKLLMSLYEQGDNQRLSVNMDVWGEIEDHHKQLPSTSSIVTMATEFLKIFGEKFARDEYKVSELREKRDALMKKLGYMNENGRQIPNSGLGKGGSTVKKECAGGAAASTTEAPTAPAASRSENVLRRPAAAGEAVKTKIKAEPHEAIKRRPSSEMREESSRKSKVARPSTGAEVKGEEAKRAAAEEVKPTARRFEWKIQKPKPTIEDEWSPGVTSMLRENPFMMGDRGVV